MPGPEPDELAIFNREWLSLLKASMNAGYLCSECKVSVTPADVAGLLLVAERGLDCSERLAEHEEQRERAVAAMTAFARDLLAVIEGRHSQHLTLVEGGVAP